MSIPVQNIYHLLTYAWDQLEEADVVGVRAEPADSLPDLLARVLTQALKRGLARDYVPIVALTGRLRGKLLLSESVRQRTLPTARAWCAHDELSHDIPANQLLKSALYHLLAAPLAAPLHAEVRALYERLSDVTLIVRPGPRAYEQVRLHGATAHYHLLLSVSQLVHEEVLLTQPAAGERLFRRFTGNERRMGALFEAFVRNFYRRRQRRYHVQTEHLRWQLHPTTEAARALLPLMRTDVSLTSPTRKLLIECKYYRKALRARYDQEKLLAAHLYQLYAYVRHVRPAPASRPVDGLLLYPAAATPLRLTYELPGTPHRLRLATLNLQQPWQAVEAELLALLDW